MFSSSDIDVMKRLRSFIDPLELSNPGKMFPSGEAPALVSHAPHPLERAGIISRE
jgi:glycolate oxidase